MPSTDRQGVEVTGVLQKRAWLERVMPGVEKLADTVWSVPVPFPDNPLRYTLCYILAGADGVVVVDPGWRSDDGWAALRAGIVEAGATPDEVLGVVVTHVHPDHHGLSGRLQAASGCWIGMHPAERQMLPALMWPDGGFADDDRRWLTNAGVPSEQFRSFEPGEFSPEALRFMSEPTRDLLGGDVISLGDRDIEVVWTPGHSAGHICLLDRANGFLLTGDHLLPRITPNIGVHAAPTSGHDHLVDPLRDYASSLRVMERYDTCEALPAHEYRFAGLAARARSILDHHEKRCDEIAGVLSKHPDGATALTVARSSSWSRGWDGLDEGMWRGAIAETLAHLARMVEERRLASVAHAGGVVFALVA